MSDNLPSKDLLNDDDNRYLEELRSMSDDEILDHMRQMRDEIRADGGKLARERGLSDEYLDTLDDSIARMERAVVEERQTNERLVDAARQMNAAADAYLKALDNQSDFPQIIDVIPERSDKNRN